MAKIKFGEISANPPGFAYQKIADNRWQLTERLECEVKTRKHGRLLYTIEPGYETDFRSGPDFLNALAPKIGSPKIRLSWLIHDVNYEGYISQQLGDTLCYFMLKRAGLDKVACQTVYIGLSLLGHTRYRTAKDDPHVSFQWVRARVTRSPSLSLSMAVPTLAESYDRTLVFDRDNYEAVYGLLKEAGVEKDKLEQVGEYFR